jgi:decaprenylphospho-beta-D-ribofuranose 2-oxidase
VLLAGWGRTAPSAARLVPADADAVVEAALAAPGPRGVLARGLGRAYGDAAQNAGGQVLDMTALRGIERLDGATGELTALAGTSLADVLRASLPAGWFPPVVPGTRFVTLGGAIAADVHGKNHHHDGSFARHVTSFELVTSGGERRTVRPGEPAWDATVGGMGLTGVIVRATLRLLPVQTGWMRTDTDRCADLDEVLARLTAEDARHRYSVAWVDLTRRGRGILLQADHARQTDLPRGAEPLPAVPPAERAGVPPLPASTVRGATVRAFNLAWWHAAPRVAHDRLEPATPYFFPLDGVRAWNRLYGPQGFVQHQFVVPPQEEGALRRVVERYATARAPAALAVLKRFGPGSGPPLSFPEPGWTLAVDLPAAWPGLRGLLDELDEVVAAAGGRVYLAKDSRVRPDALRAMERRLGEWQALRAGLDPAGAMRSDLARRLEL